MKTIGNDGWAVEFRRNVHMYCHSLKLSKAGETYDVPCEDSPSGFVLIWPYELKADDTAIQDLLAALREWANQAGIQYRLYTSPTEYETNGPES